MNNLLKVSGKTFFITGAYGYLGRNIALGLASLGAKLIIQGRDNKKLEALREEISALTESPLMACFDLREKKAIQAFFDSYDEKIDTVINNAYSGASGNFEESPIEDYQKAFELNIIAVSNLVKSVLPNLKRAKLENNDSSIINMASMYGIVVPHLEIYEKGKANPPYYGATKAALIQLTKYMAVEFAQYGIRANSLSPGPFPSPDSQKDQALMNKLVNLTPMKRIGLPEDLIGPILFLSSESSSYITGLNLVVDGGWTAW